MSSQSIIQKFQNQLTESISSNVFLKASLGNYHGNEKDLKNVYVRLIKVKRENMLSFTYRYRTRDIFKNLRIDEGVNLVGHFVSNDFRICTLFTTEKEIILEHLKNDLVSVREKAATAKDQPNLKHDKEKKRLIQAKGKSYLNELKITDQEGNVLKGAQDKYHQINQYIEILSSLIRDLHAEKVVNVVDMGSGKGYLTFALYDYLHNVLKYQTRVTGIEYREELVNLCNDIAKKSDFRQLNFIQGSIEAYEAGSIDLLIALHACDTATDDAIYKGIQAEAELIVVAPCCHKQIRREIEKYKVKNDISFLTKHGIFLERQAEMITDGIRALILEYFGYKTRVFEFISDVHTPKNILIIGTKGKINEKRRTEIRELIRQTKIYFGIDYHHLERLTDLENN